MKHILLLLLSLLSFMSVSAQKLDISILSFEMDQFDTSAQAGTQYAERDKGGELYAIIKVKDFQGDNIPDGFTFDFGTVRTLKHEVHDGDLWVWVQRNAKSVTIRHPEYRTIEKYDLGQTIQPGRVYIMRMALDRMEIVVKREVRKQVLQFVVTPKDVHATVRVKASNANDYELWGAVNANDGSLDRYIAYGSYDYQIEADSYDPSYGRINLAGGDTHVERVTLYPNFGFLEVIGDDETNGADIFVDSKKIGTVPYIDSHHHFTLGTHRIEIVKGDLFLPYTSSFDIVKGQTTRVTPQLQKDFATVTLSAGKGVQLTIDGKIVGTGTWTGPLKSGTHQITSTLASHRDATDVITIERGEDVSFSLTPPTPITGSLYVRSTPAGATVKIDGKECGTTPKAFPELLVGSHKIELVHYGYDPEVRDVTVREGEEIMVEITVDATINTSENPIDYEALNNHEWVDLGLSVKWATCNVGATTPEGYGEYFAWGETTSKSTYNWSTYKWCNGSSSLMTKYCASSRNGNVDKKYTLAPEDDVAYVNWGGNWRMPTPAEEDELRKKCKWKWTTQNGVYGYQVTSKSNGNSIFLPAAGYRYKNNYHDTGSRGYYWSNTLDSSHSVSVYGIYFFSIGVDKNFSHRCHGQTVRAVCK